MQPPRSAETLSSAPFTYHRPTAGGGFLGGSPAEPGLLNALHSMRRKKNLVKGMHSFCHSPVGSAQHHLFKHAIILLNPVTQPHPLPSSASCKKMGLYTAVDISDFCAGVAGQGLCLLLLLCAVLGRERAARNREIIKTDTDKASAGIFCFRAMTESGDEDKMNKLRLLILFSLN